MLRTKVFNQNVGQDDQWGIGNRVLPNDTRLDEVV